jgi:hypothetical protein
MLHLSHDLPPFRPRNGTGQLISKRFDAAGAPTRRHGSLAVILQVINNNKKVIINYNFFLNSSNN